MLPLPPFELLRPTSLDEACQILAERPDAKLIAGGTDLLPSMKQGLFDPLTVVSLAGIQELKTVRVVDSGLHIGAMTRLRTLVDHPHVQMRFPALAAAAKGVATSTIQRMATLGGNLMLDTRCRYYNQSSFWRGALDTQNGGCLKCNEAGDCHVAPKGSGCYAAHSADTVPALWLLDARVELVSAQGRRSVPVSRLYDGSDGRWWLRTRPGEILVRVELPKPTGVVVHRKLRSRGAIDYPLLLTAVRLDDTGAWAVVSARLRCWAVWLHCCSCSASDEQLRCSQVR